MHFFEHFTFGETDWSKRGKRLEKYVKVVIAIELVTVGTKLEEYEILVPDRIRDTSSDTASIRDYFPEATTSSEKGGSIGLSNIYRRLKITFGDHAHIRIDSKEGEFTVVRLYIPEKPENPSLFDGGTPQESSRSEL